MHVGSAQNRSGEKGRFDDSRAFEQGPVLPLVALLVLVGSSGLSSAPRRGRRRRPPRLPSCHALSPRGVQVGGLLGWDSVRTTGLSARVPNVSEGKRIRGSAAAALRPGTGSDRSIEPARRRVQLHTICPIIPECGWKVRRSGTWPGRCERWHPDPARIQSAAHRHVWAQGRFGSEDGQPSWTEFFGPGGLRGWNGNPALPGVDGNEVEMERMDEPISTCAVMPRGTQQGAPADRLVSMPGASLLEPAPAGPRGYAPRCASRVHPPPVPQAGRDPQTEDRGATCGPVGLRPRRAGQRCAVGRARVRRLEDRGDPRSPMGLAEPASERLHEPARERGLEHDLAGGSRPGETSPRKRVTEERG
jgi:hypothetical protein